MDIDGILENMKVNRDLRSSIVKQFHKFFFLFYFASYIKYDLAPMHEDLFKLTQDDEHLMWVISAFRGSGKSTILTLSYVIWSIISGRTKYVLIISENQQKAQTLLGHVKAELESNALLKSDLGPFEESSASWNSGSITLKDFDAKITAISTEQSVRGLRYLSSRPDLIILDDCESQDSVRTQESRDKLFRWLSGDVIPAGHSATRVVVIGSVLHMDSLIPRLQRRIDEKKISGTYGMWPIIDDNGQPAWPGKFPTMESIEAEKARGIDEREWLTEFMLIPASETDQIIKKEDVHYYDHQVSTSDGEVYTGVDLAISQSETADYTAIVSGVVIRDRGEWKLYILPRITNERMKAIEIEDRICAESLGLGNGQPTLMYIENVAFQNAIIEHVQARGIPAVGVSPGGKDKRARLVSVANLISSGKVLFPKNVSEKLTNQLIYFGMEKHDDLMDALVILLLKVSENEESGRLIIPTPVSPPTPRSQSEAEQEADEMASLLQQGLRGDQFSLNRYNELEQKYRKEYWDAEALRVYGALMRDSFRRRRGY